LLERDAARDQPPDEGAQSAAAAVHVPHWLSGRGGDDSDDGGGTINTLMNTSSWLKRKKPGEEARLKAEAEGVARAAEEAQAGNMLDPETYPAAKGKNDSRS
jgi:hypothetical protein